MSYRLLPVLLALATIMLVGVPGQACAGTFDCTVANLTGPTGHIDMWSGVYTIDSAYHRYNPVITRGYYDKDGRCYPLQNGFGAFYVPHFDTTGNIPACTLYYYQSAHSGSADLRVNWAYEVSRWPTADDILFWAAWDDTPIIATDGTHTTDGAWYAVPLTSEGCGVIADLGSRPSSGEYLYTGWTYHGFVDGTYTDVAGAGNCAPYIHVVY
jgi:hypothetical protein